MIDTVKILLHPVRMRIMQLFLNGKHLTPQEISAKMPDVPQATLYRHIKKLHSLDVLVVVQENKVRGTLEKVYALKDMEKNILGEEFSQASRQEHFETFFAFLLTILSRFENYLQKERYNLIADGMSFRQANIYLSHGELQTLLKEMNQLLLDSIENHPREDRRMFTVSTITIPDHENNNLPWEGKERDSNETTS